MPYNTGNPVGSKSPKDLLDNSENLDHLVNDTTVTERNDRLGVPRKTWHGMEVEFDAAEAARAAEWAATLASAGYIGTGVGGAYEDYDVDGPLTIGAFNEIFTKSGEFYRAKPGTTLPYTTSGTWATDQNDFIAVGDAALRSELAAPGGARKVKDAVSKVATITELQALTGLVDGQAVEMTTTGRAGLFRRDSSDLSSTLLIDTVVSTSVDSGTDTIKSAGHGLQKGMGVVSLSAVNGLLTETVYWVVNPTTDTFQISETFGGGAFDLTGTSQITVSRLLDPSQGHYVLSDGDSLTGSDGAFIRIFEGEEAVNVRHFGAVADAVSYSSVNTDDSEAFQGAIYMALEQGFDCLAPAGRYYAHDLMWGRPNGYSDAQGGMNIKGVMLKGEGKASTRIFTNGNNFLDVGSFQNFAGRDFMVSSRADNYPVGPDAPLGLRPQGLGIYSSFVGPEPNACFFELWNVDLQRFEVGADMGNGGYLAQIEGCHFKFCETGIRAEKIYATGIRNCNFGCKTALDSTVGATTAFDYSNNHHGLGVYYAIFGVVETTVKLVPGNVSFCDNYFEAYSAPHADTIILDLYVQTGSAGSFRNNHINVGSNTLTARRFSPLTSDTAYWTNIVFEGAAINVLSPNADAWASGGGAGFSAAIKDYTTDVAPVDGAVYASNKQRFSVRTTGYSFTKGSSEPQPDLYDNKASFSYVGDDHVLQSDNSVNLRVGSYRIMAHGRGSTASGKDVYIEFAFGAVKHRIPVIVGGNGDVAASTIVHLTINSSATVSWYFPVAYAAAESFTFFDFAVAIEPISVFSRDAG